MNRRLLIVITALLLLAVALPAAAAERKGLSITLGCTNFTVTGGSLILNRDNTGAGRERFQIIVKDGSGAAIYSGPAESFYVGATVNFPANLRTNFSSPAASNPISVSVISAAGNGLPEQVVYSATGNCANLPTVEAAAVGVTGVTSPSVPVNTLPPGGENADTLIDSQAGHGIVNTSYLNLRSGDGPEYTIVGRVRGGAKLVILGRNESASWWYVKAGDVVGWVISDFIVIRGDVRSAPVVVPAGEVALPRLFLYGDATLRATASAAGAPLCTVPGNLEYEIVGRNSSLSWVRVNAKCGDSATQGWLAVELGAIRNTGQVSIPVSN